MKNRFVLLFLMLGWISSFAQNNPTGLINEQLREIIVRQVQNNLNSNVPVFIYSPSFLVHKGDSTMYNNDMLFEQVDDENYKPTTSSIIKMELQLVLKDMKVFPNYEGDSSVVVKVYSKSNFTSSITYAKEDGNVVINLTTPSGNIYRKNTFKAGHLVYSHHKDTYKDYITTFEYEDAYTRVTGYDNANRVYSIGEIKFENGSLVSQSVFMPNENKDMRVVQKQTTYKYKAGGILLEVEKYKKKGKLAGSIKFNEGKLQRMMYYYNPLGIIMLQQECKYDQSSRLLQKRIKGNNIEFFVDYKYNKQGRLKSVTASKRGKPVSYKQEFVYRTDGLLIETKRWSVYENETNPKLKEHFAFNFSEAGEIKTVRKISTNGKVKELRFDVEYLVQD